MNTIDQSAIRKQNIRKILLLLSSTSGMTRHALAEASQLSLMSVTNLIDQLKGHNVLTFAQAVKTGKRNLGRKAELITLSGDRHAWLIIDICSRTFRFALLGFDLSLIADGSWEVSGGAYVECLRGFAASVRRRIDETLNGRDLLGVAIITPDPYDQTSDSLRSQHLPQLGYTGVKQLFREHLGPYKYIADKEVKYAVRAFPVLLEYDDCGLLYYLFIGDNLGGAVLRRGALLCGLNNTAGDAGQLAAPTGVSYEKLLSVNAFASALGLADCSKEDLLALAQERPEPYRDELLRFAATAADMLYSVLLLFDPYHIIIDCRYALPFKEDFLSAVQERLRQHLGSSDRLLPELSIVPQKTDSVLWGAVHALQLDWIEAIVS